MCKIRTENFFDWLEVFLKTKNYYKLKLEKKKKMSHTFDSFIKIDCR